VEGAGPDVGRRERGVDGGPELGGELGLLEAREGGVEEGLQLALGLVDEFADGGALLLGHGAHLFHESGKFAVGADVAGLGGFEIGPRGECGKLGLRFCEEGGELRFHERERVHLKGGGATRVFRGGWRKGGKGNGTKKEDGASVKRPVLRGMGRRAHPGSR
jgi:hypothetical protein